MPIPIFNSVASFFLKRRISQIELFKDYPIEVQQEVLRKLVVYSIDTEIGKNTYIDNQVHIAHNVKIGKNCIIAGQVGFAGSSEIGDNVLIGGQAGISGHLKIGNNVQIGGGSGVIKNIPDNTKVMGYPAKDIKLFLKENKK